ARRCGCPGRTAPRRARSPSMSAPAGSTSTSAAADDRWSGAATRTRALGDGAAGEVDSLDFPQRRQPRRRVAAHGDDVCISAGDEFADAAGSSERRGAAWPERRQHLDRSPASNLFEGDGAVDEVAAVVVLAEKPVG